MNVGTEGIDQTVKHNENRHARSARSLLSALLPMKHPIHRLIVNALLIAALLATHPATARRRIRDLRDRTEGKTTYGSYKVSDRLLDSGKRFRRIEHFDHAGRRIGSSLALFAADTGYLLKEKTKLRLPPDHAAPRVEIAAGIWSMHLRLTREPHRMPTAAAAAEDCTSGKLFFGRSGGRTKRIAPALRQLMPAKSLEPWRVDNCAEFKAVNKALLDGVPKEDLSVFTVRTSSGRAFPSCHNCQTTMAGASVLSNNSSAGRPRAASCQSQVR